MKFFIGPMSKNVIDCIINFVNTYDVDISFIPSRRQIEYNGGYVNNWSTKEFSEYVSTHSKRKIMIERDHGGPGQGLVDDDGYTSLDEDIQYFDCIHIDPWKKYPNYNDGLKWTIDMIRYVHSKNQAIRFEIGTEEGIRPFSCEELDQFVHDLQIELSPSEFSAIQYLVIQCGTKLLEKTNIGSFDSQKLSKMLMIASKYGLTAKEHNGDWVTMNTVKEKYDLGLTCINIAPEFGEIETCVILDKIRNSPADFEKMFQICYQSGKWKKWVSPTFVPEENKETLIRICGHYCFTYPEFIEIKNNYPHIHEDISKAIQRRLLELHMIYTTRTKCIFCSSTNITQLYEVDKETPICYSLFKNPSTGLFLPYNLQYCKACDTCQTKYLGDIQRVYALNHIDNFGIVKHSMHNFFADFIVRNKNITNVIEVGACHDYLSRLLIQKSPSMNITIIDPSFTGNTEGLTILSDFVENVKLADINANTLIMSSVFEHFYSPLEILTLLKQSPSITNIYINHPNMEYAIQNDVHINLTTEHTFYCKNDDIERLFNLYGFKLHRKEYFENHTICFEFIRSHNIVINPLSHNNQSLRDIESYIARIQSRVYQINSFMEQNKNKTFYLWPASMHTVPLFIYGLHYTNIRGFIDNSPNKIGKFFYGYNLECFSFKDIVDTSTENTCILLGGAENYKRELELSHFKGILFDI
jgi:hypothetical protein